MCWLPGERFVMLVKLKMISQRAFPIFVTFHNFILV